MDKIIGILGTAKGNFPQIVQGMDIEKA